jgi:hypothetical protein
MQAVDSAIGVRNQASRSLSSGNEGCGHQPSDADVIQLGRAALPRLQHNHWRDWAAVINALAVLRTQALKEAKTNRPYGARYRVAIAQRLRIHGFDCLHKSDRSRLLACADHLTEIDAWRSSQPIERQASLNHPQIVLSAWKRSLKPPSSSPRSRPRDLAEQIVRLSADQLLALISDSTRAQLEDRLLALMGNGASDKYNLAVTLTKQFRHGLSTDKAGEKVAAFETIRKKIEANGRSIHDLVIALAGSGKKRR